MKILFWGSTKQNSGPDNVNKAIIRNLTDAFYWPDSDNKMLPSRGEIKKLLESKVVVVSGLSRRGYVIELLAKILRKKLVFILHGYFEIEAKINSVSNVGLGLMHERFLMKAADLILPVSRKCMYLMQAHCPQYADKMDYLYNGIEKDILLSVKPREKISGTVAAAGGYRKVKNNDVVSHVVENLDGKFVLNIYGTASKGEQHEKWKYTRHVKNIPHDLFLEQLSKTDI